MLRFLKQRFGGSNKADHRDRSVRLNLEEFESRFLPNAGPLFAGVPPLPFGSPPLVGAADPSGQQTLTAALAGATGTSGAATFSSNTTAATNSLLVQVSGLSASSTYTVDIGGTSVGQITTNSSGSGQLSLSNISASIAPGTAVTVLDSTGATVLSGTFAPPGCSSGSSSGPGSSGSSSSSVSASASATIATDASQLVTDLKSGNLSGALAALGSFETYLATVPGASLQEQEALLFLDQVFADLA